MRTEITEQARYQAYACGMKGNQTMEVDSAHAGFLLITFFLIEGLHMLHMLFFTVRRRVMDGGQEVQSVIPFG